MNAKVTPEWLSDFSGRIYDLALEAEKQFGDPVPCTYPSDVEMLLHMAHGAAYRLSNDMRNAVALPLPRSQAAISPDSNTEETR